MRSYRVLIRRASYLRLGASEVKPPITYTSTLKPWPSLLVSATMTCFLAQGFPFSHASIVAKTECLRRVSSRGGRRSETSSRSRRERERVRGSGSVRSGRGGLRRRARERNGGKRSKIACMESMWVAYSYTRSGARVYIHVLDT